MAGDDHPDKKMVAAGESSKRKGKATNEEVENQSTSDNEISEDTPVSPESVSTIEARPVKKSKMITADESSPQAPPVQVQCPLCYKTFDTYPAMFGHQRIHKERTYRGAYPPPNFKREGSTHPTQKAEEAAEQATAQLLLEMSQGMFEKSNPDISIKESEEGLKNQTENDKLQLDLNKSPSKSE